MVERVGSANRPRVLELPHGKIELPIFLPDATQGVVRGVDSSDMLDCGVDALQMNVFHLMQKPGSRTIKALGGLHELFGWPRPIVTDSGGFQIYSLIHQNPRYGSLSERGMLFRPDGSERRFLLTPEKSVQLQLDYGADIVVCLDDCTNADQAAEEQVRSVQRTVKWARRCREEYDRRILRRGDGPRPRLFAVVQGGADRTLRKRCAEELLEIGFDGYGLGGWPLDSQGQLLEDVVACTRELIPQRFPLHALGVGQPGNVAACARMGYNLFDSTMPTRDARHGRLYRFSEDPVATPLAGEWYSYLYIQDERHIRSREPVSQYCDCLCCRNYSLAYLHHLFRVSDSLFFRLATLHNLRFMMQLVARLRVLS
jgi:queuine tRNA-ribosyltransferase